MAQEGKERRPEDMGLSHRPPKDTQEGGDTGAHGILQGTKKADADSKVRGRESGGGKGRREKNRRYEGEPAS